MQRSLSRIYSALPLWLSSRLEWLRSWLIPSVGVAAVNASALIICIGAMTLLWTLLEPSPITQVTLVRVEPENRTIDRSKNETLTVYRKVHMTRAAAIQIIRTWIDDGNGVTASLDDYTWVEAGDTIRDPVRIVPPASLNPGRHRYRVVLRWCNALKCVPYRLEDIEVLILGNTPAGGYPFQDHRF